MTLFHLRELWSTNCGTNEEFDKTSMCICNVDNLDSNHGNYDIYFTMFL